MKKSFVKLIVSFVLVIAVLLPVFAINSYADSNTILAFSSNSVTVGETVVVTVTVNGTVISGADIEVSYESEFLEFVSGDNASGGAGSLKIVADVDPASRKSFSLTFRTLTSV